MSNGNGNDSNKPFIIDVKRHTPDGVMIQVARGTADRMADCNMCRVLTNRQTAFKLNSENVWRTRPECDVCALTSGKLVCHVEGLLKKGVVI